MPVSGSCPGIRSTRRAASRSWDPFPVQRLKYVHVQGPAEEAHPIASFHAGGGEGGGGGGGAHRIRVCGAVGLVVVRHVAR